VGGFSLALSARRIRSGAVYEPFPSVAACLTAMAEDGHETVRILHPVRVGSLRFDSHGKLARTYSGGCGAVRWCESKSTPLPPSVGRVRSAHKFSAQRLA